MIPANAIALLPILVAESIAYAPMLDTAVVAAQIEHESCTSLTSKRCWSPTSELKTSREHGIGLGQHTIAYRADGSVRFNAIEEMRQQYKDELADWKGPNLYSARLQIRATLLKDRTEHQRATGAASSRDQHAFMLAAYNSGGGTVKKDRMLCSNIPGCNPGKWFGNVERQGVQSKTKWQGYGKSAFEITRHYIPDVMDKRAPKYREALK